MSAAMKIKTIEIKNYKCFKDFKIDCTKNNSSTYQWTVLLGNNNTGKTSLLKAVANLRPVKYRSSEGNKIVLSNSDETTQKFVPALYYDKSGREELNENSFVGCTTTEENVHTWRYKSDIVSLSSNQQMENFHLYGYGVSRYPSKTSLSESSCDDCDTLFYPDKKLVNIEEWLLQLDYAAKNENQLANRRLYKIQELLCGNLFPEILNFKFETSNTIQNYVLFQTKDGWFRYMQLGYGYQSMLSWIVDLCKRMFERYPNSENPLNENAIVLIDEIDLHLHPKWQRDIISFLSNAFPNIQFIATTHSPLVIQSMNDVNLYVLHREGDKVVAEHSDISNFQGWTVEEILRDTMKMDKDIRSDKYQAYMYAFDKGLNEENKEKVNQAYNDLCEILHPDNPIRRLLELQRSQMNEK